MREKAGRRAWNFEERLRQGKESDITRRCWEELKETGRMGKVGSK